MLIRAMKCGCEHCEDKNDFAAMGSSLVENEPGMIIMSKAGAFSNEFFSPLPDCLRWLPRARQSRSGESGATEKGLLGQGGWLEGEGGGCRLC